MRAFHYRTPHPLTAVPKSCSPLLLGQFSLPRPLRTMSSSTLTDEGAKLASFHDHLSKSKRILALLGAGLSASSGLPTFRGAGGLWRTYDATSLATPEAFRRSPGFVWQFYSYRRHMALNAHPNPAHFALAELAKRNPDFLTLSQNVDGLSPRADHPASQLKLLHGSLYDVKCVDQRRCGYIDHDNYIDPIVEALAIPQGTPNPIETSTSAEPASATTESTSTATANSDTSAQIPTETPDQVHTEPQPPPEPQPQANTHPLIRGLDISNSSHPLPTLPDSSLPHCPKCNSLLRPGVVWFGESLPRDVLESAHIYTTDPAPIDLMLVIGTSGTVYPAAAFVELAREKGARVAVVNPDPESQEGLLLEDGTDWWFGMDAAVVLPEMLRPVVGELECLEVKK